MPPSPHNPMPSPEPPRRLPGDETPTPRLHDADEHFDARLRAAAQAMPQEASAALQGRLRATFSDANPALTPQPTTAPRGVMLMRLGAIAACLLLALGLTVAMRDDTPPAAPVEVAAAPAAIPQPQPADSSLLVMSDLVFAQDSIALPDFDAMLTRTYGDAMPGGTISTWLAPAPAAATTPTDQSTPGS